MLYCDTWLLRDYPIAITTATHLCVKINDIKCSYCSIIEILFAVALSIISLFLKIMARNFPFDTQRQKALMELYEKEASTQLDNYLKSQNELNQNPSKGSKLSEVLRNRIERNRIPTEGFKDKLPEIQKNKTNLSINQKFLDEIKEPKITVIENFGMIPANSRVRSYLYSGFSKEGKGRIQYLKRRNELSPEEKYTYPLLSSWYYGWGIGDYAKNQGSKNKRYGRTKVVEDSFFTRTGIPIRQMDGMLQRSMTMS